MTSLRKRKWKFILQEYRACQCNKLQLSKKLGCSDRTIRHYFTIRKRGKIPKISGMIGTRIWFLEMRIILRCYKKNNYNKSRTAKELDIGIQTIKNKLKQYEELEFFKP